MRLADDDRGFEIIPEMAVHHARHRAIARHVDQRGGGCGTERHDLVIADHPVVDALRGERIDIGRAGQTDRFGARLRALLKRSEEHTSELQSLMRISYAVFCLKKKNTTQPKHQYISI